jgi:SAM-dependent methyltransferase
VSEFDRYASTYEEALGRGLALSGEDKEFFAQGRVRWLADRVGSLGAHPRVLDFGCGTGTAVPFLARELDAPTIVGTDLSEDSLAIARSEHGDIAHFVPLSELGSEKPYDLVYCNGVFHHVPPVERPGVIRLIFSVLRPGGVFSLWENNPYNPGTRWVMSRIPFDRDAVLLHPGEARRLATSEGFDVLGTDFLFIFPGFLAPLRRLEPSLAHLPLGAQYQVLFRRPPEPTSVGAPTGPAAAGI